MNAILLDARIERAPLGRESHLDYLADRYEISETGCWLWTGGVSAKNYGQISSSRIKSAGTRIAHRFAYELLVGPIPEGLTLDHLCRVRICVNPDHLEPVSSRENTLRGLAPAAENLRKAACIHGHEFTPENTRVSALGHRCCLTCERLRLVEAREDRRSGRRSPRSAQHGTRSMYFTYFCRCDPCSEAARRYDRERRARRAS